MGRSPTFVVGAEKQRDTLDGLKRREQHFTEAYQKNKPLCFNAKAYQKTHPRKAAGGQKDADATLTSPMLVSVADGVSQMEDFGIDASELPNELLSAVEELAVHQLVPADDKLTRRSSYAGPISMLRQAYEATTSLGSTTVLMAVMDNSTRIHGKLHPMIAILSVGDCEIVILRRSETGRLDSIFHTEMQRIDGHAQSPLQLARVDDSIDPNFDESMAIEVIERGSAVHCVSAFEGDIFLLGSDGVFDNLFVQEIVDICNEEFPPPYPGQRFVPTQRHILGRVAKRIVKACHAKTQPTAMGWLDAPIGKGGKIDDTSCIVGEVVEWTEEHRQAWSDVRRQKQWADVFTCGGRFHCTEEESDTEEGLGHQNYPSNPNGSFSTYAGSFSEYGGSFRSIMKGKNPSSFSMYQDSFSEGSSFMSVSDVRLDGRAQNSEDCGGPGCCIV